MINLLVVRGSIRYCVKHLASFSSLVTFRYNPLVLSSLKDVTASKKDNNKLWKIQKATETVLERLNESLHKKNPFAAIQVTNSIEKLRSETSVDCLKQLDIAVKSNELNTLFASMSILMSRSERIWTEYDTLVSNRLQTFEMDTMLLACYALLSATEEHKFNHIQFKTPSALVDVLLAKQQELRISNPEANVFSALFPVGDTACHTREAGGEIATSRMGEEPESNSSVEQLSIILQLLAHCLRKSPNSVQKHTTMSLKHLLAAFGGHSHAVFSAAQGPLRLASLKDLWTYAPRVFLPSAHQFYSDLYVHVLRSVQCDPLQLVNQELAATTLLESMVASKFKNSQLVRKVEEVYTERGMDFQKVGVRLFNALAELGAVAFGVQIVDRLMRSSAVQLEDFFRASRRTDQSVLTFEAMERVFHILHSRSCAPSDQPHGVPTTVAYLPAHLTIALMCFSKADRTSDHFRLIERIELDVLPSLKTAPFHLVLSLFHSYALAGRALPSMLRQFDLAALANLSSLSSEQLVIIFWSCARLNHGPATVLDPLVDKYFADLAALERLNLVGCSTVAKVLWSLAVLQRVEWTHMQHAHRLMSKVVVKGNGWEMHPLMAAQLSQVAVELEFRHEQRVSRGDVSAESVAEMQRFLAEHASSQRVSKRHSAGHWSSHTHKDASRLLSELGVTHQNEKLLPCGYSVDIFIPRSKMPCSGDGESAGAGSSLGLVLELDGPFHFETYLMRPLGPAVMKVRHLRALGYQVVSLPFWEFHHKASADSKMKVLQRAISG